MAELKIKADSNGGTVSLKGPATTTSNAAVQLTLPVDDGTANQYLKTDGSGALSWADVPEQDASTGAYTLTSGSLVLATAGTGIDFAHGAQADLGANLLDDYEEGNWDMTFLNSVTAVSNQNNAHYIKIGRLVHIQCQMELSSDGNGNDLILNNLPFATENSTEGGGNSIINVMTDHLDLTSDTVYVTGVVNKNGTELQFKQVQDNNWSDTCHSETGAYVKFGGTYIAAS